MAKGYVCDLTGKNCQGEGIRSCIVELTPRLSVIVIPQERLDATHFGQGDLSPEAVAVIEKALAAVGKTLKS